MAMTRCQVERLSVLFLKGSGGEEEREGGE